MKKIKKLTYVIGLLNIILSVVAMILYLYFVPIDTKLGILSLYNLIVGIWGIHESS